MKKIDKKFVAFWIAAAIGAVAGALFMIKAVATIGTIQAVGAVVHGYSWSIGLIMGLVPYGAVVIAALVVVTLLGHQIEQEEIVDVQVID